MLKRTVDLINLLFSLMIPYTCLFLNCGRILDFSTIVPPLLRSGVCALFCVYTVGKGKHTEAEGTHFFVFFLHAKFAIRLNKLNNFAALLCNKSRFFWDSTTNLFSFKTLQQCTNKYAQHKINSVRKEKKYTMIYHIPTVLCKQKDDVLSSAYCE